MLANALTNHLNLFALLEPYWSVRRKRKRKRKRGSPDNISVYGTTETVYGTTNTDAGVGINLLRGIETFDKKSH